MLLPNNPSTAREARRPAAWARLVAGALVMAAFVFLLMQGYAPPGPAGDVLRNSLKSGIDATPLFYTDLETPYPDD